MTDTLREVGLLEKEHSLSSSLSGGQKRKLSVALALTGSPTLCILDEPTSGDPAAVAGGNVVFGEGLCPPPDLRDIGISDGYAVAVRATPPSPLPLAEWTTVSLYCEPRSIT